MSFSAETKENDSSLYDGVEYLKTMGEACLQPLASRYYPTVSDSNENEGHIRAADTHRLCFIHQE
jgi:hypothetical protein